jgi:hypothetical protein
VLLIRNCDMKKPLTKPVLNERKGSLRTSHVKSLR